MVSTRCTSRVTIGWFNFVTKEEINQWSPEIFIWNRPQNRIFQKQKKKSRVQRRELYEISRVKFGIKTKQSQHRCTAITQVSDSNTKHFPPLSHPSRTQIITCIHLVYADKIRDRPVGEVIQLYIIDKYWSPYPQGWWYLYGSATVSYKSDCSVCDHVTTAPIMLSKYKN